jgi:hypothetical protein
VAATTAAGASAARWSRRRCGFCEQHNYLKVTLDTFMEREPRVHLFEKFRFRHFRTRNVAGKELMYFLLDLYAGDHAHHHDQNQGQQPQRVSVRRYACAAAH